MGHVIGSLTTRRYFCRSRQIGIVCLCCIAFCAGINATAAELPTVFMVKTKALPKIDAIVDSVNTVLTGTATTVVLDMRGDTENSDSIVQRIQRTQQQSPVLLISIGTPATRLLAKNFPDTPLVYTMTRTQSVPDLKQHSYAVSIAEKASLTEQIYAMQQIISPLRSIGILTSANRADAVNQEVKQLNNNQLTIDVIEIRSEREVPQALADLSARVDALLFVQDPNVLNRNSLEYIVTSTLAMRKPTMVYSEFLVRAGFMAASIVPLSVIGQRAKQAVFRFIAGSPMDLEQPTHNQHLILVNTHTLNLLELAPPKIKNVEYITP